MIQKRFSGGVNGIYNSRQAGYADWKTAISLPIESSNYRDDRRLVNSGTYPSLANPP
jgi:hypothetical protein